MKKYVLDTTNLPKDFLNWTEDEIVNYINYLKNYLVARKYKKLSYNS